MKKISLLVATLVCTLAFSQAPRLWGITRDEGANGLGTIYSVNKEGLDLQVHHSFNNILSGNNSPLFYASDGKLYGNHPRGGTNDAGSIYSINPTTDEYIKHFDYDSSQHGHTYWAAGFCEYQNNIYTVSYKGGANNQGAIISMNLDNQSVNNIFNFDSTSGFHTYATLQVINDDLFGVTQKGGLNNGGTLFKFNITNQEYTILHHFELATGEDSNYDLLNVGDSILYGAARDGGDFSKGTLFSFKISSNEYTNLASFDNYLNKPNSALAFYDNALYGISINGGQFNEGALYKYNFLTDSLYEIYSFSTLVSGEPWFSSLMFSFPYLIGATGKNNDGSVYKFNLLDSTMTITENFNSSTGSESRAYFTEVCIPSYDSIVESACQQYITPSGKVITQSGTFNDTISNTFGCDSVIYIDLTVQSIDLTINVSDSNLVSNQNNSTYQWYDCNANEIISGENNSSFTPNETGDYAVILTENGCSDTTDCINFVYLSIDNLKNQSFKIFPNPSNGQFQMVFENFGKKELTITSQSGQTIVRKVSSKNNIEFDLTGVEAGVYFLAIVENGTTTVKKIVIK